MMIFKRGSLIEADDDDNSGDNISDDNNDVAAQDGDSDSDEAHPQQQNRTRQKKFVKNFKQLPSEEVVLQSECKNNKRSFKWMTLPIQGYSCALMSDILLQGHLYVTENYIAFHSNVFGYVTRVIIVTALKKITPNELFSKCFPCLLLDLPTIKDHHTHNIMIIKSQHFNTNS